MRAGVQESLTVGVVCKSCGNDPLIGGMLPWINCCRGAPNKALWVETGALSNSLLFYLRLASFFLISFHSSVFTLTISSCYGMLGWVGGPHLSREITVIGMALGFHVAAQLQPMFWLGPLPLVSGVSYHTPPWCTAYFHFRGSHVPVQMMHFHFSSFFGPRIFGCKEQ